MARKACSLIELAQEKDLVWLASFANLVAQHTLANIDPSKFMSYQEGMEAGRLAEREQKPVAWIGAVELMAMKANALAGAKDWRVNLGLEPEEGDVALYTIPPQRTRIELTDDERQRIRTAVLKEKNT
jgi:NADPH-dependent glutamate synthase beta subunit-like oxidoreductase